MEEWKDREKDEDLKTEVVEVVEVEGMGRK